MEGLKEKKHQSYPLQSKKQIAEEVISGKKGVAEASRDYNIPRGTIMYWAKRYRSEILIRQTREVLPSPSMEKPKESKDPDLEQQVHSLEEKPKAS